MKVFKTLIRLLLPFLLQVSLAVLISSLSTLSTIGLFGTSGYLITFAAFQPSIAELQVAIVGVRFFGIARAVLKYIERLVSHNVSLNLLAQLRNWIFEKLSETIPFKNKGRLQGDLLASITSDIEVLQEFFVRVVAPPLTSLIVIFFLGIFIGFSNIHIGFLMALLLLVTLIIIPVIGYILSSKAGRDKVELTAELNQKTLEYAAGIGEVNIYQYDALLKSISEVSDNIEKKQQKISIADGITQSLSFLFPSASLLAFLYVFTPLVHNGDIWSVNLAVLSMVILSSFEVIFPIAELSTHLSSAIQSGNRILEIIQTKQVTESSDLYSVLPENFSILQTDQLGFSYSSNSPAILENISFQLHAGQKTAIVGPNGAGKSTLLNLLLRYWEPFRGKILLDQTNAVNYAPDSFRKLFSVISHRSYLFRDSIRNNLKMGNPDASDQEIQSLLAQTGLLEWVGELPGQMDHLLQENGANISSGQRQRLLMIRALLRESPILLLDEPTSFLDEKLTEEISQLAFHLGAKRSMIWVTHKLLDMERFDQIHFLDQGTFIETGTHSELMKKNGLYTQYWFQYQQQTGKGTFS